MCYTIEQISAAISIATPPILLIWFYYSQKLSLSKSYYTEINGTYAGFTERVGKTAEQIAVNSGIIMAIKEIDEKGFFKGEFEFRETVSKLEDSHQYGGFIHGRYLFLGKLEFTLHRNKTRHPLRPKENRLYKGTLYIISRFDFSFDNYEIDDYVTAEYTITHYREMQTLRFTLKKNHKSRQLDLPDSFTLFKKRGVTFEPYETVKDVVFSGKTKI